MLAPDPALQPAKMTAAPSAAACALPIADRAVRTDAWTGVWGVAREVVRGDAATTAPELARENVLQPALEGAGLLVRKPAPEGVPGIVGIIVQEHVLQHVLQLVLKAVLLAVLLAAIMLVTVIAEIPVLWLAQAHAVETVKAHASPAVILLVGVLVKERHIIMAIKYNE